MRGGSCATFALGRHVRRFPASGSRWGTWTKPRAGGSRSTAEGALHAIPWPPPSVRNATEPPGIAGGTTGRGTQRPTVSRRAAGRGSGGRRRGGISLPWSRFCAAESEPNCPVLRIEEEGQGKEPRTPSTSGARRPRRAMGPSGARASGGGRLAFTATDARHAGPRTFSGPSDATGREGLRCSGARHVGWHSGRCEPGVGPASASGKIAPTLR